MRFFLSCCFCFSLYAATAQNTSFISLKTARFITGDSMQWKDPAFADSSWKTISTSKVWQAQGFPDYHGFAWYRIHVVIPSSLKKSGIWGDSLRLFLAHVNDVDETFFNGVRIGQIGRFPEEKGGYISKWPAERSYHLSARSNLIRWDAENVISIRVYDGGGSGGLFMGEPYIDMLEKIDGIEFTQNDESTYLPTGKIIQELVLQNHFGTGSQGKLHYQIRDVAAKQLVHETTMPVTLAPLGRYRFRISLPHREGIEALYEFTENESGKTKTIQQVAPYLLTPAAGLKPVLNNPARFGVRPSSPFLYKIPASGSKPIRYAALRLPPGLQLDAATGVITGTLSQKGSYAVQLSATNRQGTDRKLFTIECGSLLALTPPMGWNSWNCWGISVSDEKVRSSARALLEKGLADYGWGYINIDDGWEAPERATDGTIVPNEKFPDMKALGTFLHTQGLKFGIYSSPGPRTCGGYLGSYQHELQDAQSYARWGIDYLKYDLCSYSGMIRNGTLADHQKPYFVMRDALRSQPRDVLYSLCQYGVQDVWKWGREVDGNLWRTTGDITDTWESLRRIGFSQQRGTPYAGPGGWNDPDMLIVGKVGWGENLHPTHLTPYEQYTHISLWCLLSAPLLIGCDISKMDRFTLNLLTNNEVLAIDQDPLGRQAQKQKEENGIQVYVKELQDGSKAVGIFNLNDGYTRYTLPLASVGVQQKAVIRDVWTHTNTGLTDQYTASIPPHGVRLLRLMPGKP